MVNYYIGGTNSQALDDSFTFAFIDRNGYAVDDVTGAMTKGAGSTNKGFEVDSACFVLMDYGVSDQLAGLGIASATDIDDPSTLDWEYGIYATQAGLFAINNGTAVAFESWGSDPLYTQGDFQDSVIDRLATPPAGSNGNRYLIIATASGDWTGHEDDITEYQDAWVFIPPSEGMMTWVEDEDVYYVYSGSAWAVFSSGASTLDELDDVVISGTPANNELLAYDTGGNWINQTHSEAGVKSNFTENTAFNKTFGTGTTNIVEIGSTLGNSQVAMTNSSGKLVSEAEQTGHNLILGTGSGQVSEGDHDHDTRYPQDGTYYLYLPAAAWQFGTMHNDTDMPLYNDNKSMRRTYGGVSDMKFALLMGLSDKIPIPPSSTVTITQVDVRMYNEGGSTNPILTSWKTNWDDNPNDTLSPVQSVTMTTGTSSAGTTSLTTDIVISGGDVAWIEVAGSAGWRYYGNVRVTYTIAVT